jgi:predicted dienelactone hydrolase
MPRRCTSWFTASLFLWISTSTPAATVKVCAAVDSSPNLRTIAISDLTWFDASRGRNVPVRMYFPSDGSERCPVVVFSTGLGCNRDDCGYLGRRWAGAGYVAVHVQHPGSDKEVRRGVRSKRELHDAFYNPANIRNRPLDLIFVIDQLERLAKSDAAPGNRFDVERIGAAGHDFGAQTALALAGQVLPGRLSFPDRRVKAVVAMGEPVPLGQIPLDVAYAGVTTPCLHVTGTADNSIVATTTASQRRLPFDHARGADQYLVTFFGLDHLTYSGHARKADGASDAMFHRLIAETSIAFWDAYLKGDADAKASLHADGLAARVGSAGRVEKKIETNEKSPPEKNGTLVGQQR